MRGIADLTGKRFGTLTVIEFYPQRKMNGHNAHWLCECDCGRKLIVRHDNLRDGRTKSCSACRGHRGLPSVFVWEEGEVNNGIV